MMYKKLISRGFYISNIVAILAIGLVLFFGVVNLQYGFNTLFIGFFIILPLILACLFVLAIKVYMLQVSLNKKIIKPLWLQRVLYICVVIFASMVTSLVSWAVWDMVSDKPPQFFSFNDPKGSYTIIFENGMYWLTYNTTSTNTYAYCSAESGVTTCTMTVFIASSPVDLKQFLNKKVVLGGEFVTAHKQCILDTCREYGSNYAGLRIDKIQKKVNL